MRLENIKEGDPIAVYHNGRLSKGVAGCCTKTQVQAGDYVFLRRTGRRKGAGRWESLWADKWDPSHDLELVEELKRQNRTRLYRTVSDFEWRNASEAHLESVVRLMSELGLLANHKGENR